MRRLALVALVFFAGCSGCNSNSNKPMPDAGTPDGGGTTEVLCETLPPATTGTCDGHRGQLDRS